MSKRLNKNREPSLMGHYAGFVSRFIAVMIDLIIIIAVLIIGAWTANLIIVFFNLGVVLDSLISSIPWLQNVIQILTVLSSVTFVFFAYTVLFWVFTAGQTVGKAAMGLRIVAIDGRRLTFWRAVLRYIMFWVAILPLGLGLLWVLLNNERRGWHDLVAGTCVIYSWNAREDKHLLHGIRKRIDAWNQTRFRLRQSTQNLRSATTTHPSVNSETTNAPIEASTHEQNQ